MENQTIKKSPKVIFGEQLAKRVQEDYGFYWIKCMDMAMTAVQEISDITSANVDEVYKQLKKDIDSNKIF